MKTYLFDFDGTLVDSMNVFSDCMYNILDSNNISYSDDIMEFITPLGYDKTAEYFVSIGVPGTKEEIVRGIKDFALKEYSESIPAKKNVIEVLKKLKSEGASLNILTASPQNMVLVCLKRLGIYEMFDNIWSCEDFKTTKSNPEIYVSAADRLGVSVENVLFLDDNFNAVEAAKKSGMTVCGVYDKSSEKVEELMKNTADFYIFDFSELLNIKERIL